MKIVTIHSVSPDGQDRYDTVIEAHAAKMIAILKKRGQLKIKVIK